MGLKMGLKNGVIGVKKNFEFRYRYII